MLVVGIDREDEGKGCGGRDGRRVGTGRDGRMIC